MPIFAMCENLLPAAFDDIGAAVLMPDPEVTTTTTTTRFRWPSRKFRILFSRRRRRCGAVIRVVRGVLSISLSHVATLHFLLGVFSDFLLTLQGECALSFSSWTLFRVCFFSNNQHFSVFYITLWNCFTDLVLFFLLFNRTSVVYVCI